MLKLFSQPSILYVSDGYTAKLLTGDDEELSSI